MHINAKTERRTYTGWPHFRIVIKSYRKPANEAKFFITFECLRNTGILSLGIKYSMRDLIHDIIN